MGTRKAEQPMNISVMLSLYIFLLQKMHLIYGSTYIVSCCGFLFLSLLQNLCLFNVQGTTWWLRSLHEEYSAVSACKQLNYICIRQSNERMGNRTVDIFHWCVVSVWPQLTLYDVWNGFGCFSVSLAPLSTYPLLRTIDKVTSIHPHIWIRFSLVSTVNNRTRGLDWMEEQCKNICAACTRYLKISSV